MHRSVITWCAGRVPEPLPAASAAPPAAPTAALPRAISPVPASGFAASAAMPVPGSSSTQAPHKPPRPITVQIAATTPSISRQVPTSPKPLVGASPMSATPSQDAVWPSGSLLQALPGVIVGRQVCFLLLWMMIKKRQPVTWHAWPAGDCTCAATNAAN